MLTNLNNFLDTLPSYGGIFLLMLSGFLIGYFGAQLLLKRKYRALSDKLKKELNALKAKPQMKKKEDIDSLFSEIKPRIIEVVKEAQQTEMPAKVKKAPPPPPEPKEEKPTSQRESVAQKARATYLKYQLDKPELDFDSIGYADHDQKDDLTRIMGIGPYIEQKLNEIGICTYDQLSRLNDRDIQVITELIDFFPGRIERDNWVGQARALKVS